MLKREYFYVQAAISYIIESSGELGNGVYSVIFKDENNSDLITTDCSLPVRISTLTKEWADEASRKVRLKEHSVIESSEDIVVVQVMNKSTGDSILIQRVSDAGYRGDYITRRKGALTPSYQTFLASIQPFLSEKNSKHTKSQLPEGSKATSVEAAYTPSGELKHTKSAFPVEKAFQCFIVNGPKNCSELYAKVEYRIFNYLMFIINACSDLGVKLRHRTLGKNVSLDVIRDFFAKTFGIEAKILFVNSTYLLDYDPAYEELLLLRETEGDPDKVLSYCKDLLLECFGFKFDYKNVSRILDTKAYEVIEGYFRQKLTSKGKFKYSISAVESMHCIYLGLILQENLFVQGFADLLISLHRNSNIYQASSIIALNVPSMLSSSGTLKSIDISYGSSAYVHDLATNFLTLPVLINSDEFGILPFVFGGKDIQIGKFSFAKPERELLYRSGETTFSSSQFITTECRTYSFALGSYDIIGYISLSDMCSRGFFLYGYLDHLYGDFSCSFRGIPKTVVPMGINGLKSGSTVLDLVGTVTTEVKDNQILTHSADKVISSGSIADTLDLNNKVRDGRLNLKEELKIGSAMKWIGGWPLDMAPDRGDHLGSLQNTSQGYEQQVEFSSRAIRQVNSNREDLFTIAASEE